MDQSRLYGQARQVLTPEQSVRMALEEHGMLRSAEYEVSEARAVVEQARAGWWPSIRGQASYMRLSDNIPPIAGELPGIDSTFTIAPVELNRYHAAVSVEQPLFTGFRRANRVEAAEHRAEAARADVEQHRADVAFEARQIYWTLFEALSQREALETASEQIQAHLQDVQNRAAAGAALQRDLLAAQTRRAEVRLERVQAENAVRVARLELQRIIGEPRDTEIVPRAEVDVDSVQAPLEELTEGMFEKHPELRTLRRQIDALRAEINASQGQWYPDVSLTGRYIHARPNQYFFAEQDEFHGTWEAGLSIRWNLWNGGIRSAETEQVTARLRAAQARLEHMETQIITQVTREYLEVEGARAAVEVVRQVVDEAEETFRVVRQQYQSGSALSADVLEAEAALRSAQAREAEAVAQYAAARAALLNATGQVW